jgi:cytochrome c peroxidase
MINVLAVAGLGLLAVAGPALATEANLARDTIVKGLAVEAKAADPAFAGFSAERGAALFRAQNTGGKPDTPSCTTCHTSDPTRTGQTRAGKDIQPMAVSLTPERFTDPEKVAKWFERNCVGVLGRACTPTEKGDFLTFMLSR